MTEYDMKDFPFELRGSGAEAVAWLAPSLTHAIGDRSGGRVQLRTCTLEPYAYVACEHPEELLEAIKFMLGPGSWLECDDGRIVQLRYVVQARVEKAAP